MAKKARKATNPRRKTKRPVVYKTSWKEIPAHVSTAHRENDSGAQHLNMVVTRAGGSWQATAIEFRGDNQQPHGHTILGQFATKPKAKIAAETFLTAWAANRMDIDECASRPLTGDEAAAAAKITISATATSNVEPSASSIAAAHEMAPGADDARVGRVAGQLDNLIQLNQTASGETSTDTPPHHTPAA